ncbi:YwpF-like family protein [Cytobacillus sp. FJAT-54145]|uniref:YwpF-like family protein n=1 Tax=Cytobacillus spartinae TaxID=3299023 RepID=A0ABW6KC35_9BACI
MKTFKLISMQVFKGDDVTDIELSDGLIINKEDEHNTWLMEVYLTNSYFDFFQNALEKNIELTVQVVISKKENDPATFQTKVKSVKKINSHISILLEGTLKKAKSDYAELLLNELLKSGLVGEELLSEFKSKMISRPRLVFKDKEPEAPSNK